MADPADGASWADIAGKVDVGTGILTFNDPWVLTLDTVIDCIGGAEIKALGASVFETTIAAAKKARPAGNPALTFIYCSG